MSLPALTPHSVHCTLHLPPVIVITQYCAAVALADVTSANIVGYNTVTLKPGWNMIGSFFPAGWKLNDEYYTPSYWQNSGAIPGSGSANADYIQVWDATTEKYTTYLLYKPAKGASTATYTWTDLTFKTVTTDVLSAGKGAWYYHRGEGFNLEIKKQF